ncbi:uncharacterized protein LOC116159260 isoform X2 [Photinus pyralis]|uniref:uncharacterized protein LOC116159260 isoform X2 n=1 Tax=Photinus pyralis TaxID=7054 RepID=UPI00126700A8|nr:uncharacterized protein LOC116159260 isoform X2 [Photinus pyralis]
MMKPLFQSGHTLLGIAAFLGIFQGLGWTILAIMGVTYRFVEVPKSGNTLFAVLESLIGQALQVDNLAVPMPGMGLFVVVIIYLVISLVWVTLSTLLILSIRRGQHDNLKRATLAWGVMTLLTCVYDLVVTGLLASNYDAMLTLFHRDIKKNFTILYSVILYGILMSMAARGYVLWVINFIMSVLMIRNGTSKVKEIDAEMLFDPPQIEDFQAARNLGQHDLFNREDPRKRRKTSSDGNITKPSAPHYVYPYSSESTEIHIPRVKVEMRSSTSYPPQLIRNKSIY